MKEKDKTCFSPGKGHPPHTHTHTPILRPVRSACLWAFQSCFPLWTSLPQLQGQPTPWCSSVPRPPRLFRGRWDPEQGPGLEVRRRRLNGLLQPLLFLILKAHPCCSPWLSPGPRSHRPSSGHVSTRAGDLGLDRGLPPGLASSDLGEGGDRVGPSRSLPGGGAFTHMVRVQTPSQASRPNLTTGSVILSQQSRALPDLTLEAPTFSHWAAKAPRDPLRPPTPGSQARPRRLVPIACCTDHEATGHCHACGAHAVVLPPDGHCGRGVTQPFSQSRGRWLVLNLC